MASITDWPPDWEARIPNFTAKEVACRCGCGGVPEWMFMRRLQRVRIAADCPMPVTSGFRCPDYDKLKGGAGVHPTGHAADIAVSRRDAFWIVVKAGEWGMHGIGVRGRGDSRFVHLDDLPIGETTNHPRPRLWTYDT